MYTDCDEFKEDEGVWDWFDNDDDEGLNIPKFVELFIEPRSWNWFNGVCDFGHIISPLSLMMNSKI